MASMIPDYINEFTTEGERRFYYFLQAFAKPDDLYTTWYLPDLHGQEPDFILYCNAIGLIVFEVKDWSLDQIREADPHSFLLRMGKDHKRLKSPLHQARDYLNSLMDTIKADGQLVSRDTNHYGKAKIPIDCGVVFPNISRSEYCRRGLEKVIDINRIFFEDDLHRESNICLDDSGKCFHEKLVGMFPPRFRFHLTEAEYDHLKQLLFPIIRIKHPPRNTCAYIDPSRRINVLDDRQEAIARRCTPGINLIGGPAGTGKTLILVQKAAFLRQYRPEIKNILFVCRNIALVNYTKRLLSEKGVGIGPGAVEVYHFFELCSKVLGEQVQYENASDDYYQLVVEEALSRTVSTGTKYDAVLVDEGQDFTEKMIEVVVGLANADNPNLTIAADEHQGISSRWITANLKARYPAMRIDRLGKMHRNTLEIHNFISKFMKWKPMSSTACDTSGPAPQVLKFGNYTGIARFVSETIRTFHGSGEYPLSEMAILYAPGFTHGEKVSLPEIFITELESRGIITNWIAEDYRSKRSYDITTDMISISTVNSAKGLDYACVFLVGLDEFGREGQPVDEIRGMVYTAITRARHRLFIPYVRNTGLVEDILASL
jgi:hypothetical protein